MLRRDVSAPESNAELRRVVAFPTRLHCTNHAPDRCDARVKLATKISR
jgi:hypothetical protein